MELNWNLNGDESSDDSLSSNAQHRVQWGPPEMRLTASRFHRMGQMRRLVVSLVNS